MDFILYSLTIGSWVYKNICLLSFNEQLIHHHQPQISHSDLPFHRFTSNHICSVFVFICACDIIGDWTVLNPPSVANRSALTMSPPVGRKKRLQSIDSCESSMYGADTLNRTREYNMDGDRKFFCL